jgi:hypothetical protein
MYHQRNTNIKKIKCIINPCNLHTRAENDRIVSKIQNTYTRISVLQ